MFFSFWCPEMIQSSVIVKVMCHPFFHFAWQYVPKTLMLPCKGPEHRDSSISFFFIFYRSICLSWQASTPLIFECKWKSLHCCTWVPSKSLVTVSLVFLIIKYNFPNAKKRHKGQTVYILTWFQNSSTGHMKPGDMKHDKHQGQKPTMRWCNEKKKSHTRDTT